MITGPPIPTLIFQIDIFFVLVFETPEVYLAAGNHDSLTFHSCDFVDLLVWILCAWAWLRGICIYQKSRLFRMSFLRHCKLDTLGTLGMPGHTSQKEQYQLMDNFDVYLHAQ